MKVVDLQVGALLRLSAYVGLILTYTFVILCLVKTYTFYPEREAFSYISLNKCARGGIGRPVCPLDLQSINNLRLLILRMWVCW